MTIRCKMECFETGQQKGWSADHPVINSAKFRAVSDGSPENKSFFAATPSGELSLGVVAGQHFEAGKFYYVSLELAE